MINTIMKKTIETNIEPIMPTAKKKYAGKGGARPGAGRPRGSSQEISVKSLLETIKTKSGGKDYEEILVTDFFAARIADPALAHKYHHLILNKVMNTLAKIEVTDSADAVETKKLAFADALAKLIEIKEE
jgi:hypothetical protein